MTNILCGIDFGTTNSAIAVTDNVNVTLVPLEQDSFLLPTAIFCSKTKWLFGNEAIEAYLGGGDGRFMRSMKRILGTDLMNATTLINNKYYSFDSLISSFLKEIKLRTEAYVRSEIDSVVIGRPVHYQDYDPNADKLAEEKMHGIAKSIGFKNIVFQYEPIAAAFAHEQNLIQDKIALVVDLGGGTSDFTIIRIGPAYSSKKARKDDILATSGIRIGGNDCDRELSLCAFMPQFGRGTTYGNKTLPIPEYLFSHLSEWSKINFTYTPKNIKIVKDILLVAQRPEKVRHLLSLLEEEQAHQLLQTVEQAKIDLTTQKQIQSTFELDDLLSFNISLNTFEQAVQSQCDKIINCAKECLMLANLKPDDIDLLILTGGTSKIPLIYRSICKLFPYAAISDTQRMESVALGLAHTAKRVF